MPRESSGGYTRQPPLSKPKETKEVTTAEVRQLAKPVEGTFVPSDPQRLARARVLTAARNDPLLKLSNLNNEQLAKLTRMPSQARNWLQLDGFKEWLTASTDTEERVEFLLSTWLDEMSSRIGLLSDKDLISTGKLLAEISHKQVARAVAQQPALDTLDNDQLKKILGDHINTGEAK